MANNSYILFNSGVNVNIVKVEKTPLTFNEAKTTIATVNGNTILHSIFDKDRLDALYIPIFSILSEEVTNIYRKSPTQNYFDYLTTLETGHFNFSDYNIENEQWYHYLATITVPTSNPNVKEYLIYELKDTLTQQPVYAYTNWNSFAICSIEALDDGNYSPIGNTWSFSANLDSENLIQNRSVTVWDTLGKYPNVSEGRKNYMSGTVSCLLGGVKEINNAPRYTEKYNTASSYSRNNDLLERWHNFCSDGYLKLLKDIKGNKWIVEITDNPSSTVNVSANEQITTISFSWTEVDDSSNVSIIRILEDG